MDKEQVKRLAECQVCGKFMKSITNTHLKKHALTVEEYKKKFGVVMVQNAFHREASKKFHSRKYEDRYGLEKSKELKKARSGSTKKQMQDVRQRELRSVSMKKAIEVAKSSGDYLDWVNKMRETKRSQAFEKNLLAGHMFRMMRLKREKTYNKCEICQGQEGETLGRLLLHHKNYERLLPGEGDLLLVCKSCHASLHAKEGHFQPGVKAYAVKRSIAMKKVNELLRALGVDLTDENFVETPRRFTDVLLQFLKKEQDVSMEIEEVTSQVFPTQGDQMIFVSGIEVFGFCPHHLLPVEYRVSIAYLPSGFAMGLSKFARVVKLLASVSYIQETLTEKIKDVLSGVLGTDNVGVSVTGIHYCMVMRGIEQPKSQVTTIALGGSFLEPTVKGEFLKFCR